MRFGYQMLNLPLDTAVIVPDGPVLVRELKTGSSLLAYVDGAPTFIEIAKLASRTEPGQRFHWVFSTAGDISLPSAGMVATSNGLSSMRQLASQRVSANYGVMSGMWPSLEVANVSAGNVLCQPVTLKSLIGANVIPSTGDAVFRVGARDKTALAALRKYVTLQKSISIGPAGWAWLHRPPHHNEWSFCGPIGRHELADLAQLFLRRDGDDEAGTAAEDWATRALVCLTMRFAGVSYGVDFKPLYCPLSVSISPVQSTSSHAPVKGVVTRVVETYAEVDLAIRGAYLVCNGFLVAA
jgi:hypothetical protein